MSKEDHPQAQAISGRRRRLRIYSIFLARHSTVCPVHQTSAPASVGRPLVAGRQPTPATRCSRRPPAPCAARLAPRHVAAPRTCVHVCSWPRPVPVLRLPNCLPAGNLRQSPARTSAVYISRSAFLCLGRVRRTAVLGSPCVMLPARWTRALSECPASRDVAPAAGRYLSPLPGCDADGRWTSAWRHASTSPTASPCRQPVLVLRSLHCALGPHSPPEPSVEQRGADSGGPQDHDATGGCGRVGRGCAAGASRLSDHPTHSRPNQTRIAHGMLRSCAPAILCSCRPAVLPFRHPAILRSKRLAILAGGRWQPGVLACPALGTRRAASPALGSQPWFRVGLGLVVRNKRPLLLGIPAVVPWPAGRRSPIHPCRPWSADVFEFPAPRGLASGLGPLVRPQPAGKNTNGPPGITAAKTPGRKAVPPPSQEPPTGRRPPVRFTTGGGAELHMEPGGGIGRGRRPPCSGHRKEPTGTTALRWCSTPTP